MSWSDAWKIAEKFVEDAFEGKIAEDILEAEGFDNPRKRKRVSSPDDSDGSDEPSSHSSIDSGPHRSFAEYNMANGQHAARVAKIDSNARHDSRGTGVTGGQYEVDVVPVPRRISTTVSDYFTINLPYMDYHSFFGNSSAVMNGGIRRTYRLNSIFDPCTENSFTHQPMGRDTWDTIYKYYRVLACVVKMTVINHSDWLPTSDEGSPTIVVGYEQTDLTSDLTDNATAFMESKHTQHRIVTGAKYETNRTVMTYSYSPATWDTHIQETGIEERWTPLGENPPAQHLLAATVYNIEPGNVPTNTYTTEVFIEMMYTVQFREAKPSVYKVNDGNTWTGA